TGQTLDPVAAPDRDLGEAAEVPEPFPPPLEQVARGRGIGRDRLGRRWRRSAAGLNQSPAESQEADGANATPREPTATGGRSTSSAGSAGATYSWGEVRKGGGAPLRVSQGEEGARRDRVTSVRPSARHPWPAPGCRAPHSASAAPSRRWGPWDPPGASVPRPRWLPRPCRS